MKEYSVASNRMGHVLSTPSFFDESRYCGCKSRGGAGSFAVLPSGDTTCIVCAKRKFCAGPPGIFAGSSAGSHLYAAETLFDETVSSPNDQCNIIVTWAPNQKDTSGSFMKFFVRKWIINDFTEGTKEHLRIIQRQSRQLESIKKKPVGRKFLFSFLHITKNRGDSYEDSGGSVNLMRLYKERKTCIWKEQRWGMYL